MGGLVLSSVSPIDQGQLGRENGLVFPPSSVSRKQKVSLATSGIKVQKCVFLKEKREILQDSPQGPASLVLAQHQDGSRNLESGTETLMV